MDELNFETLSISYPSAHVLQITLNRPQVQNAINSLMWQELRDIWQMLYVEHKKIRVIILTGSGNRAFSAGADLKERNNLSTNLWLKQHRILEQSMRAMIECPIPIIAAVNGIAYGGGLELLLACDLAYAVSDAKFAFPETKLGIMPGALGTQFFSKICGIRVAKEVCIAGKVLSAEESVSFGLINTCYANREEMFSAVYENAKNIANNSPQAVRQVKKSLNASLSLGIDSGYRYEIEVYNALLDKKDRYEGIQAFNEKRKPEFVDD